MSSFREWCQSQQELYDQKINQLHRKSIESNVQATGAPHGAAFLREIMEQHDGIPFEKFAEQYGSGTLLASNYPNEDMTFNVGTF